MSQLGSRAGREWSATSTGGATGSTRSAPATRPRSRGGADRSPRSPPRAGSVTRSSGRRHAESVSSRTRACGAARPPSAGSPSKWPIFGLPPRRATSTPSRSTSSRARGTRKLGTITIDDTARLVAELRREGKGGVDDRHGAARCGSRLPVRRPCLGWHGSNPVAGLEAGERPRVASSAPRRVFTDDELSQTLAAARPGWRELFALAATTGARQSELLALRWGEVVLEPDDAHARISEQLDRSGRRVSLKTEQSRREVVIPRATARLCSSTAPAARTAPTMTSSSAPGPAARSGKGTL